MADQRSASGYRVPSGRRETWRTVAAISARSAVALFVLMPLAGCTTLDHGFLAAAGPVASEQRELFWIIAAILVLVGGPVLVLTPIMAWYYRLGNTHRAFRPKWTFSWRLEGYIWIPPVLIVVVLAIVLYIFTTRLDPYKPLSGPPPLEVQAVALDWKWVFVYPQAPGGRGIASVNRLVVPAGRPVRLMLTSGTVMQSILIPRLSGQIYAMAGMTSQLNIQADRPGGYRGENTQFNGDGFSREKFDVVALPEAQYRRWMLVARDTGASWDDATARRLTARGVWPTPQTFRQVPGDFFAGFAQDAAHGHSHAIAHKLGPTVQ